MVNSAVILFLLIAISQTLPAADEELAPIKATPKKVSACEAAKLASEVDPENSGKNVDCYVAKLDELVKKFSSITTAVSPPKQESLAR